VVAGGSGVVGAVVGGAVVGSCVGRSAGSDDGCGAGEPVPPVGASPVGVPLGEEPGSSPVPPEGFCEGVSAGRPPPPPSRSRSSAPRR
jgi:hypothetical protein